jgi:uncharacterized cupin superfamily protein
LAKALSLSSADSLDLAPAWQAARSVLESIVLTTPPDIELEPRPIPEEWILSGHPMARSRRLAGGGDRASTVVVWDCTAGRFHWHYTQDETTMVVSGDAYLISENGEERHFGPGDVGFFPAGTDCAWRIAEHFRKVALLQNKMWWPLALCLRAWKKLLR